MSKLTSVTVVIVLALIAGGCQRHSEDGGPRGDIERVLDSLQIKLDAVERRIALEQWQKATHGFSDSLAFFQKLRRSVTSDSAVFSALRNGRGAFSKDTDRRRHDLLYPIVLSSYVDNEQATAPLYDSLIAYLESDWCLIDENPLAERDAQRVMERGLKPADREKAYRALSLPDQAGVDLMGRLFRMRDQAAKRQGYNDYFSLVINTTGSSVAGYDDLVKAADTATLSSFEALRSEIQSRQGAAALEIWNWRADFRRLLDTVDLSCPADSQLSMVRTTMLGLGFNLDKLPIYIHTTHVESLPAGAEVLVVDVPDDIRVIANLHDGFSSLRSLMAAVGRAVSMAETGREFAFFARHGDPVWEQAMAQVFERLCLRSEWLSSYAHVPESLAVQAGRAYRAIDIFETRLLLVNSQFEREAYTSATRNLASLYWDVLVTFTGLPRHDDLFPWAADRLLVTRPLGYKAELLSRIIAAQTLSYLNGRYDRVTGNAEVRSFLIENYFRFGSRYDWQDLLERGTGTRLSPAALADSVSVPAPPAVPAN